MKVGADKRLLILDLDETLVHARSERLERTEDCRLFSHAVYVRPHLDRIQQKAAGPGHLTEGAGCCG